MKMADTGEHKYILHCACFKLNIGKITFNCDLKLQSNVCFCSMNWGSEIFKKFLKKSLMLSKAAFI